MLTELAGGLGRSRLSRGVTAAQFASRSALWLGVKSGFQRLYISFKVQSTQSRLLGPGGEFSWASRTNSWPLIPGSLLGQPVGLQLSSAGTSDSASLQAGSPVTHAQFACLLALSQWVVDTLHRKGPPHSQILRLSGKGPPTRETLREQWKQGRKD